MFLEGWGQGGSEKFYPCFSTLVKVLCVRDRRGRTNADHSPLLHVDLPPVPKGWCGCDAVPGPDSAVPGQDIPVPEAVGWEANKAGKLAPR
eukprot:scaffold242548_cov18-Tisochrysis_lutea.AAC.1